MGRYRANPAFALTDEATLRAFFPSTHALATLNCLSALHKHAVAFIRRSPFLCIGTQGRDGRADVSPRGDPSGFVTVLDAQRLAIPNRPRNNRLDPQSNILANLNAGLLFFVPGFDDSLRINGRASLTTYLAADKLTGHNDPGAEGVARLFELLAKA